MNNLQKYLSTCLLGIAALLVGASPALAHNFPSFAVLAGTAVTCTDSKVTGDVGIANGNTAAFTNTRCMITGGVPPATNTVAATAYSDFLTAYSGFISSHGSCTQTFTAADTLSGLTLGPGNYCFTAAATLAGTLTLTGTGPWTFEIGTGGTGALTATGFTVVMAGGSACNVTWWVAQAATLTSSIFQGTILAGADITVTGTVLNGDAVAGGKGMPVGTGAGPTGAVTLTGSVVADCSAPSGGSALPICAKPDRDGDDEDENDHDRDHDRDHHDRDHDKNHDGDHDRN